MIPRPSYCSVILVLAAFYAGEWVGENRVNFKDPQSSKSNGFASLRSSNDALPNTATQSVSVDPKLQPAILELTWKEKMRSFFSSKECIRASPDFHPEQWLGQFFILIGVQKGGTKAIHTFLEQHPQFVSRCSEKS